MTKSTPTIPLVFQVFNEIGIINQLSTSQLGKALAPDLNISEFGVLNHFVRVGGEKTPSRLARIFQMTKPSMTAILGKLSAKGYIEIVSSEEDRRSKRVSITVAGKAARERGISAITPKIDEINAGFDVQQLAEMLPVLSALRAYLDTARDAEDDLKR